MDSGTVFGDFLVGVGTFLGKIVIVSAIAWGFALLAASFFTIYVCAFWGWGGD